MPPRQATPSFLRDGEDDRLDPHEGRIQRLEDHHVQVATQVAAQTTQITHMSATLDRLGETVENSIDRLTEKLERFAGVVTSKLDQHSSVIQVLQAENALSDSRWNTFWSVAKWPLMLLGGGIITKFGEHLLAGWLK